jgi:PAS domain-containing protein
LAPVRDDDDGISGIFEISVVEEPPELASSAGRIIDGRYEIVEVIGSGGMGQVLRVRHRRLGKPFALKLMLAEFSLDPESCDVFHREARLASALSHPNIVSIVDFGEDPDWGLFIVMELIDGELLSKRIDELGPLPVTVVCDVAAQLASALQHSHERGVVHGDLKPENVACVISADDDRRKWSIKLLDYGMARLVSAPHAAAAGRIGGTPEYLAPERIQSGVSAPSVDIYALGVLLYEMLTGSVPFSASDPEQTLRLHLSEAPVPLRARRPDIEPRLAVIIERALAKDPAERYREIGELADELRESMRELGLARRAPSRRPATAPGQTREDVAAAAFEALGVPAAGIAADGTIVIVNRKFLRFLQRERADDLEGQSLLDTALAEIHPGFREDLRHVAMDNKVVRRRIHLRRKDGAVVTMRLLMTPARGCGECLLVLFPVPGPGGNA